MRDCENCKHRVMKVEVGKGTSPEHFWGCECWECEFEPTTKNASPKYCDRSICLKNEYNNVGCEDCEVTKSQEPTAKNDLEVVSGLEKNSKKLEKDFGELDCISRADAIHAVSEALKRTFVEYEDIANKVIGKLPSVTPQEPRKGHWEHGKELGREYQGKTLVDITYEDWHCSNCHCVIEQSSKPKWSYCPSCGAKMVEPQKSER